MRLLDAILDANQRTTAGHAPPLAPGEFTAGLPLVALTCIDARLNHLVPEALGVPESHFIWLRNAGNIITGPMSSTMRSLALACAVKGGREILILGHSDCLVRKTGTMELLGKFAALGIARSTMPENLQEYFGLFASERQNVLKAVEHVRASPLIGPRVPVHGALMDLATGRLELLVNGYQTLDAATSAAHPATAKASEAMPAHASARPASESKAGPPLGDMKFPDLKIGEVATHLEIGHAETPKPAAEKLQLVQSSASAKPPPVPADAIPNLKRLVDLARHYRIIGGDGKHYGPVPATVLLRWITDGRIDAETPVQVDGSSAWVKLHQLGDALHRLTGKRK
ncbi:MAG: carbonic anhydrase [Limisphaerales bacterium]